MNKVWPSNSAQETRKFGEALGRILRSGDILALAGELGAGKTELVKGIARGLGCEAKAPVASPTYVLLREYPGRKWLYHFDFYRIASVRELEGIGYSDYFEGDGVCVAEWADKFPRIFPKGALWIKLKVTGEASRELELETESQELWEQRLEAAIKKLSSSGGKKWH